MQFSYSLTAVNQRKKAYVLKVRAKLDVLLGMRQNIRRTLFAFYELAWHDTGDSKPRIAEINAHVTKQ